MKTAYSYVRFSSGRQAKGDSLRRQVRATEVWCKANGYRLADQNFHDLGVSAWKGKNFREGGLYTFREAVKAGAVAPGAALVVENLDRLSRDEVDVALSLFSEILRAGITIVTLTPERTYTRDSLKSLSAVMEAILTFILANEESEKKSVRLRSVWKEKRKAGGKIGPCPAWILWDGQRYVAIPDKAKVIQQIYQWSAHGIGNNSIIRRLTAGGVEPIGRGKRWNLSYISLLLGSRSVLGERVYQDGSVLKDYYPAIIDRDLYFRAQAQVRVRSKRASFRGRGAKLFGNLFAGLLKDARDGGSLTMFRRHNGGHIERVRRIIGSSNAVRGLPVEFVGFPLEELELALLMELKELRHADFFGAKVEPPTASTAKSLHEQLAEVAASIQTLQACVLSGQPIRSFVELIPQLEAKRARLESELEDVQSRQQHSGTETLIDDITELISEMTGAPNETEIRERLQGRIRYLLSEVVILITREKTVPGYQGYSYDRIADVDMRFRNGKSRKFRLRYSRGVLLFE